jgi:hypothetical protein
MAMENLAFLYIPDISGFTKFVTQTELEHSNEIISDLIEIIIKSNLLKLKVSEIEGDSVLFYLLGMPPTLEKIIDQSKKMFINFHATLKEMARDFDCNCAACTKVSNLTLKFISHYGECKEMPIQNFTKLIGRDVILAHRLLKNSVPDREYILLSEKYLESQQSKSMIQEDWIKIEQSSEVFEDFGEINTKYISLTPLKNLIPKPV